MTASPLSPQQLNELDGLLAAATPGPWRYETDSCDCGGGYPCGHEDWPYQLVGPTNVNQSPNFPSTHNVVDEIADLTIADAALIAAAITHLPALLAMIRRQQAVIDAVTELAGSLETVRSNADSEGVRRGFDRGSRTAARKLRAALASPAPTEATT